MWRENRKKDYHVQKKKNNSRLKDDSKLIIELEENAEELFASAIEDWKPYEHEDEFFSKKKGPLRERAQELIGKLTCMEKLLARPKELPSNLMEELRQQYTGLVYLKVIGKGLHSKDGVGVLSREIHDYISNKYIHNIMEIDDSPCDVLIHGVPIRGHFNVVLKF